MQESRTAFGQVLAGTLAGAIGCIIAVALSRRRQFRTSPSEVVNNTTTVSYLSGAIGVKTIERDYVRIDLEPDEEHGRVLVMMPLGGSDELKTRVLEGFPSATDNEFVIRLAEDIHHTYEVIDPTNPSVMPNLAAVAIAIGTITDEYYEDSREFYRLPGRVSVTIGSPVGQITFRTASGYYHGSGIFVYTPGQRPFDSVIIDAFEAYTHGQFLIQPAPGSSSGGDSSATYIISAGIGMERYDAHCKDSSIGYFKSSAAPRLPIVVELLARAVADYVETSRTG